jgi:hypothetical protein
VVRRRTVGRCGNGVREPGEVAPGGGSMRRRRAEQGGGISGYVSKEVVGQMRRRCRWPGEQGGGGSSGVCARDLAVRENGGGRDQKTKEGIGGFQTCLYSSVNQHI